MANKAPGGALIWHCSRCGYIQGIPAAWGHRTSCNVCGARLRVDKKWWCNSRAYHAQYDVVYLDAEEEDHAPDEKQ